jgi:hypothetical protein
MFRMTSNSAAENQTLTDRIANRTTKIWTRASLAMAKRNARSELRRILQEDIRQQKAEREQELARSATAAQ